MKKVIFEGAYGLKSFGDDAPLIVLVDLLRANLGEVDAVVITRHTQDDDYSAYGIRSIPGLEYETKKQSEGKWFRGFNPNDDKEDLCELYKEIESSDLLVLGAGNFLVDYTIDILKGPVPRFLLLSLMAEMTGTPIFWFGMSVGPLKTKIGMDMSRLAASLATVITVRDEKSLGELNRLTVTKSASLLPDAAFGLVIPPMGHGLKFSAYRNAHTDGRPVIAISVRSMPGGLSLSTKDYISLMARTCDRLIEVFNCNLLFIPQCCYEFGNYDEDDRNVAKEIIKFCKNEKNLFTVEEKINAYDCLSLYEKANTAICTRLHGNVFSLRHGVPTIGINYNPKVLEFYKWLGCEEYVLDIDSLCENSIIDKLSLACDNSGLFAKKSNKIIEVGIPAINRYAELAIAAMEHKKVFS